MKARTAKVGDDGCFRDQDISQIYHHLVHQLNSSCHRRHLPQIFAYHDS